MISTSAPLIPRLLRSPLAFLLFLIIPAVVVGMRMTGRISHTLDLLLVNNALLLVYLAAKVWLLFKNRSLPIRYTARRLLPLRSAHLRLPLPSLRQRLAEEGFSFDASGLYAEKEDRGYRGTLLAYAALLLLLACGMYDNLRQLDGTILLGVGEPAKLYEKKTYGVLVEGMAASVAEANLKLQIRKQILPSPQWPQGATEIALLTADDRQLQSGTVSPGHPMRQGDLTIHMNRFVYDAWVVVTTVKNLIIYTDFVKLLPRSGPDPSYSHFGDFSDPSVKVEGAVWLDPERKALRVHTSQGGRNIVDTELLLWGGNRKIVGDYVAKFEGLGQWSEIHVTRQRHKAILAVGGALTLLGLALRLIFPASRIWLEPADDGCLVKSNSRQVLAGVVE